MTWHTKDPIDCLIKNLRGKPRKILTIALCLFVTVQAIAIAVVPLTRVKSLAFLSSPFESLHRITRTHQSWGMFHSAPETNDFHAAILTGRMDPISGFVVEEKLGPVLPGFEEFSPRDKLRYFQLFSRLVTEESLLSRQKFYLERVREDLRQRYEGKPDPPTHFVFEAGAERILPLNKVRASRKISVNRTNRTEPTLIISQ